MMIRIRIADCGVVTPANMSLAASRLVARAITGDCGPDLTNPLEVVRQAWTDAYGCAPIQFNLEEATFEFESRAEALIFQLRHAGMIEPPPEPVASFCIDARYLTILPTPQARHGTGSASLALRPPRLLRHHRGRRS